MSGQAQRSPEDTSGTGKPARWTDVETEQLMRLWLAGRDTGEIAEEIGRPPGAVSVKASRLGLPHRSRIGDEAQSRTRARPCLSCRTPFPSEGRHHRICDSCKSGAEWGSGDYLTYY